MINQDSIKRPVFQAKLPVNQFGCLGSRIHGDGLMGYVTEGVLDFRALASPSSGDSGATPAASHRHPPSLPLPSPPPEIVRPTRMLAAGLLLLHLPCEPPKISTPPRAPPRSGTSSPRACVYRPRSRVPRAPRPCSGQPPPSASPPAPASPRRPSRARSLPNPGLTLAVPCPAASTPCMAAAANFWLRHQPLLHPSGLHQPHPHPTITSPFPCTSQFKNILRFTLISDVSRSFFLSSSLPPLAMALSCLR